MTSDAQQRVALLATGLVLTGLCLYGLAIGPAAITVKQVLQALTLEVVPGWHEASRGLAVWQQTVIWQVRIPRVLVAALVGASLSVCGAVLQGLFRNPLASPDILGMTSGASLGAAIAIFFGLASSNTFALSVFAIGAACVTMTLVYGVSIRAGRTTLSTLILAGVAIGIMTEAVRSFVLSLALQSYEVGAAIIYWSLGTLDGRTWEHVLLIAPGFLVVYVIARSQSRELDILLLGEVHAVSVGVEVARVRMQLLLATAALAGVAVATAGGIGFVGLMTPHLVRMMVGSHHRHLLPMSAVGGAIVLVGADLLLRSVFADFDIPVGALTALMGAPFFVFLLLRQRRSSLV